MYIADNLRLMFCIPDNAFKFISLILNFDNSGDYGRIKSFTFLECGFGNRPHTVHISPAVAYKRGKEIDKWLMLPVFILKFTL